MSKGNVRPARPKLRRLAFVALGNYFNIREIARGVVGYATPSRGFIVREFVTEETTAAPMRGLAAWRPDAVVHFLSADDAQVALQDLPADTPTVSTSWMDPGPHRAVVVGDALEYYEMAHRHFAEIGVRRVVQFNLGDAYSCKRCQSEYERFNARRGVESHSFRNPEPESLDAILSLTRFDRELVDWLNDLPKPVGLFSQQTFAGQYMSRACEVLGHGVPDEVAIIGADSFDVANSTSPAVTSFVTAARLIGENAARVADDMLAGKPAPADAVRVGGGKLVHRGSTQATPQRRLSGDPCNIDAALEFITEHACDGAKVNDVIRQTQRVSRVTFHKQFLKQTGATPAAMLQARRMEEARRLLTDTAMSNGAIAALCGYVDYLHFYRVFKKVEGVSPTEFRRQAQ